MKALMLLLLCTVIAPVAQATPGGDASRWRRHAEHVSIVRDTWGIAHTYGKTDADAVFGMIYAQAEDDFNRVETNYMTSLGRTAEAVGESAIWTDLRQKLFIDPVVLKLARDERYFTFLRDSPGDVRVVLGDARRSLAAERDAAFELLGDVLGHQLGIPGRIIYLLDINRKFVLH